MITQFELHKAARELAESLMGEKSARKISEAVNAKFGELQLDDEDYDGFCQSTLGLKNQYENFNQQPTKTEAKRKQAEAAKPKA